MRAWVVVWGMAALAFVASAADTDVVAPAGQADLAGRIAELQADAARLKAENRQLQLRVAELAMDKQELLREAAALGLSRASVTGPAASPLRAAAQAGERPPALPQPEQADVDSYVRYALGLAAGDDKQKASWHLTNALAFGQREADVLEQLRRLPQLGSGEGVSLMKDGKIDPDAASTVGQLTRYVRPIDVAVDLLARKARVSPASDAIEARMLRDEELVGDGKCHTAAATGTHFLVFLRDNSLSIAAAKERYGEPTNAVRSDGGGEYAFWGRICLFRPPGETLPGVFRFVYQRAAASR